MLKRLGLWLILCSATVGWAFAQSSGDVATVMSPADTETDTPPTQPPPPAITSPEDEPELCRVAQAGDIDRLNALLSAEGEVVIEARGLHGRTPLMCAAGGGQLASVALLLQAGASVEAVDDSGSTALFFPPPNDDPTLAALLLASGARLDHLNKAGHSALWGAAIVGHAALVKLFIERGIDLTGEDGRQGLVAAVEQGHLETADALVEAGVEVDAPRVPASGGKDASLLYRMAETGKAAAVIFLLDHGAKVDTAPPCCAGATPLLAAARRGHVAVLNALLAAGADIEATDDAGWTPLLEAARSGHEQAVQTLLEAGVDAEGRGHEATENTPLLWAAMEGHPGVARRLLEHGVSPDTANRSGVTPLMHAAFRDDRALAQLLLEHDASVDRENRDGRSPLLFAVFRNHLEIAKILLEHGARLDVESRIEGFGRVSPLMLAAGRGHLEMTRLLLAHQATVDAESSIEGLGIATPLMMAARRGHLEVVKLLLVHGADPAHQRRDGSSALSWAQEQGHDAIAQLLAAAVDGTPTE